MKNSFANLRLNRRIFFIGVFYSGPLTALLYLLVQSRNANLDFVRSEISANAYQRPLVAVLTALPQHELATATERVSLATQIDSALGEVKNTPAAVVQEWGEIKSAAAKVEVANAPNPEAVRARYFHLISNVRTMLAQADAAAAHDREARREQLRAQQDLQLGAAAALVFAGIVLVGLALAGLAKAITQCTGNFSICAARVAETALQLVAAGKTISGAAQAQAVALEESSSSLEEMASLTQRTAARTAAAKNISPTEAHELLGELANATAEQHVGVAQINVAISNLSRGAQEVVANDAQYLAAAAFESAVAELLGGTPQKNFTAVPFSAAEKKLRRVAAPVAGRTNVPADSKNADAEFHNL